MTNAFDLIIMGGGPSGLSAAIRLQNHNQFLTKDSRFLVLEKEKHPREKLCGGALLHYGMDSLQEITGEKLTDHVAISPIREIRFDFADESLSFFGDPMGAVVDRSELDSYMANVARRKGVELRENENVLDIVSDRNHFLVRTDKSEYRTRMILAADGSRSLVRRTFDLKRNTARTLEFFRTIRQSPSGEESDCDDDTVVFDFNVMDKVRGYAWDFPHPTRKGSLGVYDSNIVPGRGQSPKRALSDFLMKRNVPFPEHLRGFPIQNLIQIPDRIPDGIVFSGDALGTDPLFGEGIAFAILTGVQAADGIRDVLAGDVPFRNRMKRYYSGNIISHMILRARIARITYRLPPFLLKSGWKLMPAAIRLVHRLYPELFPSNFQIKLSSR